MPTFRWLAIGLVLGCATVRADLITPGIRDVDPRMSFAGVEDHADYVFLVHVRDKSYWGPNVPFESRVIPIPGPQPFTPGFRSTIEKVAVLAVPKAAYDTLSKEERQALSAESPGVLSRGIPAPQMKIERRAPDPATIRYRVALADGKLVVEPAEPDDRESSAVPPAPSSLTGWGIALAASVAWPGIIVGRRLVGGDS